MPGLTRPLQDAVALVTGGSSGIGAEVARRLSGGGTTVVIADVADDAGQSLADEIGGHYIHCDVKRLEDNEALVDAVVARFGGVDVVHLNAGITTGCSIGEDFDVDAYRRAMSINLDGVVFGVHASLPALRARGGGVVVATSSMAGIVPAPTDPFYTANKHAVVGFMRSLASVLEPDGVRVHALCPWFADTPILGDTKAGLEQLGLPILSTHDVADAFLQVLASESTGEAWAVLPGTPSRPIEVHLPPGWPLG